MWLATSTVWKYLGILCVLMSPRYMRGKVFILLGNAKLALFRRFPGKIVDFKGWWKYNCKSEEFPFSILNVRWGLGLVQLFLCCAWNFSASWGQVHLPGSSPSQHLVCHWKCHPCGSLTSPKEGGRLEMESRMVCVCVCVMLIGVTLSLSSYSLVHLFSASQQEGRSLSHGSSWKRSVDLV